MKIVVCGETLVLDAGRALFRPALKRLYVADLHFGKAAAFRGRGVPVPAGTTRDNLQRLDALIERYAPRELVFLGDFAHARLRGYYQRLRPWRAQHGAIRMLLVRGNHDARAGDPPAELEIETCAEPVADSPFVLRHAPSAEAEGFALTGHLHPCFTIHGRAHETVRLPCFWLTRRGLVLPAFGAFTGGMAIQPDTSDRVFVIAGNAVLQAWPRGATASA